MKELINVNDNDKPFVFSNMIDGVVYINTVDEYDQFLHEQTMRIIEIRKKGENSVPNIYVKINDEILNMDQDHLYELLMMKSIDRALTDPDIAHNTGKSKEDNQERIKSIMSLFKGDKATVH